MLDMCFVGVHGDRGHYICFIVWQYNEVIMLGMCFVGVHGKLVTE